MLIFTLYNAFRGDNLNKLKYKFMMFMQGRYGVDEFYNFLLVVYLVLFIFNCFVHSSVVSTLILLLIIYTFFRVFSKNISARQKENAKYLILKRKVTQAFGDIKKRLSDKNHVYRRCPHCKATLRFPRKKGNHNAVCPRCGKDLKINILF